MYFGTLCIGADCTGGLLATEHLLRQGRRRIAFLGDVTDRCPEFKHRYEGFLQAHEQAGVAPNPTLQFEAQGPETSGFEATRHLLDSGQPFDAIVAAVTSPSPSPSQRRQGQQTSSSTTTTTHTC